MRRKFFLTFSLFSLLWVGFPYFSVPSGPDTKRVESQIQRLEEIKRGFEAKAIRYQDQADRLQFQNNSVLEARRYNKLAEENRAKAKEVQKKIDQLKRLSK